MTVTLTKDLNESMHPKKGRVYGPHSIPDTDGKVMVWSHPDDMYVITLDLATNVITGHWYDWDEEAEDWTDKHDVDMTADEIMSMIKKNSLLMVKR